jgi:hypothetical protein
MVGIDLFLLFIRRLRAGLPFVVVLSVASPRVADRVAA